MTHHLEIDSLSKTFDGKKKVLDRAHLCINRGEISALLGPSGSGKTTMLRCIAGLEHPDEGSIRIEGKPVFDAQTFIDPSERHIGLLFQDYALFPHLTVEENVHFGLKKLAKKISVPRVTKYLELCSIAELRDRFPHQLSGGQQQRVALARALAIEPSLLLLDEPFSNVDESLKGQLRKEMAALIKLSGSTALMVVHDVNDAFSIADQINVMVDGRVIESGPSQQLYHAPKSAASGRVTGDINVLRAEVTSSGFDCELGSLMIQHKLTPGTSVDLLFRPETLEAKPTGDWSIEDRHFSSRGMIHTCQKGLTTLKVLTPMGKEVMLKDTCTLQLDVSSISWEVRQEA